MVERPAYFGGFVRYLEHKEYLGWHQLIDALRGNRPTTWDPATQDSVFDDVDPVMLELFWEAKAERTTRGRERGGVRPQRVRAGPVGARSGPIRPGQVRSWPNVAERGRTWPIQRRPC